MEKLFWFFFIVFSLLSVGFAISILTLTDLSTPGQQVANGFSVKNEPADAKRDSTDISLIVKRNLFSDAQASTAPFSSDTVFTNAAQNRFRLSGTIAGGGKKAVAIIEDRQKGKHQLASVGETVEGLGFIVEIESKKITVQTGEKKFSLFVADTEGETLNQQNTEIKLLPAGVDSWMISRTDLTAATAQVDRIIAALRLNPRYTGNTLAGYEIAAVTEQSLPHRMGLRQGDLITAINDRKVQSFDQLYEMYQNMPEVDKLKIDLIRAGQKKTFNYEVR